MPEHNTVAPDKSLETLYVSGDYKGAIRQLLEKKSQFSEAQFYFNLGTLHAKDGQLAVARFQLEKAQKLGFINTFGSHNLELVKMKLQVDDLSSSGSWPDTFYEYSTGPYQQLWPTLTLVMLIAMFILIYKKIIRTKKSIGLFLLLSLSPVLFWQMHIKNVRLAIALKETPIFEGPSAIYSSKSQLRGGSKIIIGKINNGWSFIERPIFLSGWVSNKDLGMY